MYNQVPYAPEGLEAIIFTADGDMRQALNNLQATFSGFRFINQENVFKVDTQFIILCMFNAFSVSYDTVMLPGVRSTTSLTCQEHGEKRARWKV
jgi:hypothetical protein